MAYIGAKRVGAGGGRRWYRYVVALLLCAFVWNIQYIYSLLEPRKDAFPTSDDWIEYPEPTSRRIAENERQQQLETDDRGEPVVSAINISSDLSRDAISRAKSDQCRRQLIDTAYLREHNPANLNPLNLERKCPLADPSKYRQYVGCYTDHPKDRLLRSGDYELQRTNSIDNCIQHCARAGQELAGLQYGVECFCGSKKSLRKAVRLRNDSALCEAYRCPGNQSEFCGGFKLMAIYETGVGKKFPVNIRHVENDEVIDDQPSVKIVFLLQLNGRSSRQVRRMLKLLYRRKHFYYVHVDERQSFMQREMLELERILPNFKVKRKRFSSIWGGASLLAMILDSFKELLDEFRFWPWQYVINLSEADMPLVSVDVIERLLRKYSGTNFLRSHGNDTASFIRKQGLDQVFVECDHRMYRLGRRALPDGVRFDGGSDWFGLHRTFIEYAVRSDDQLATGLRKLFETALLPAESFFHTLAINSRFCLTMTDSNLKLTNWRRKQGCKCQYKHIVDWCGCSPNVLKMDDWDRLEQPTILKRLDYFARKFDAMIDQAVIRRVEAQINEQEASMTELMAAAAAADAATRPPSGEFGSNYTSTVPFAPAYDPESMPGFHAYWENQYDILDQSMAQLRLSDFATWLLLRSLARFALKRSSRPDLDSRCGTRCHNLDTVQRLHVYKEADIFEGLLLQFNGTCVSSSSKNGRPWSLETFVRKLSNMTKFVDSDPLAGSLLAFEVGTKFDVKEEIFRNYAGAMAVDGEIAVRHEWDGGALKGIDTKDRKVDIVFQDPSGSVRGSYVQLLDNPTGVEYFRLPVTKDNELEPGAWKVQLRVHKDVVLAETWFLLLPMDSGQDEDASYVDGLISQFYRVDSICRAPTSENSPPDDCEKLFRISPAESSVPAMLEKTPDSDSDTPPLCKTTYWSSLSPDPKSEIHGFDWKRGLIFPR